jgi:hypothetical protein
VRHLDGVPYLLIRSLLTHGEASLQCMCLQCDVDDLPIRHARVPPNLLRFVAGTLPVSVVASVERLACRSAVTCKCSN